MKVSVQMIERIFDTNPDHRIHYNAVYEYSISKTCIIRVQCKFSTEVTYPTRVFGRKKQMSTGKKRQEKNFKGGGVSRDRVTVKNKFNG